MAERTAELRSSSDTSALLRQALARADHIRSELGQLREQAFVAAAGSAASSTDAAAAPAAGAGLQLALPHDPAAPAGSGGQPLVLPVVLLQQPTGEQLGIMSFKHLAPLPNLQQHGSSAGGPHFAQALLGAGPDSPGLPTGERRAAPKSSGGGSSRQQQQSGGGSWSIAAAWAPVQHPLAHAPQQQLWTPAAAVHPAGPGSSFDDVLAALRAEGAFQGQLFPGDEEAADALATRRCQRPHASPASQRRRQALPAPGSSARGGRLGGSSIKAQRTPGAQQQQQWLEREPLPTFDPLEVERRLKEKLDQVHAAKRRTPRVPRSSGGSAPSAPASAGASGVPSLPLASLSRAGSTAGSQPNSGRLSDRENEQQQQQQHGRKQQRGGGGMPAAEGNFLPLAREGRSSWADAPGAAPASASDGLAGTAVPLQQQLAARKHSQISLSELLASPAASSRAASLAASAHSGSVRLRHSSFSVADAASAAASAAAQPAAAAAAVAAAKVQPGEAAAPPIQDTPRDPPPGPPSEQTPRDRVPSGTGKARSLMDRVLSPFGKLQSPPSTPLDAAAGGKSGGRLGGGREHPLMPAAEASSASASSGTVGGDSPDQQRHQQAASPVRPFPGLHGEGTEEGQQAAAAQLPRQQAHQRGQVAAQAVAARAPSASASASRLGPAGSASIGRKRSNSEVGPVEQPASVKKRSSPELGGRLLPRAAEDWGGGAAAAAAALEAAAEEEARPGAASLVCAPAAESSAAAAEASAQDLLLPVPPSNAVAAAASGAAEAPAEQPSPRASRLVVPVLLQHSPTSRWRLQRQPQVSASKPAQPPAAPPAAPAEEAAAPGVPVPQLPRSAMQAAAAQREQQQRQEQGGGQRAPVQRPSAPAAAAPAAAAREAAEQELPSHSRWVASPREMQPQGQQEAQPQARPASSERAELPSQSVLISSSRLPAAVQGPAAPASSSQQEERVESPTSLPASALAAAAAALAAAAAAAAVPNITPRRRMMSLEPPEAGPCLQEEEKGKQLLAAAPDLGPMLGGALLDAMQHGCVVRKAWVRHNFKAGGSTRRLQLAPGSGGRPELLYPSGLFRKPLRFAAKRAIVNSPSWRPGGYLVLDTARGMLRLEPASPADHARWVLALNAAFLASGAVPGGASGGSSPASRQAAAAGEARLQAVGAMRWSPAILFG